MDRRTRNWGWLAILLSAGILVAGVLVIGYSSTPRVIAGEVAIPAGSGIHAYLIVDRAIVDWTLMVHFSSTSGPIDLYVFSEDGYNRYAAGSGPGPVRSGETVDYVAHGYGPGKHYVVFAHNRQFESVTQTVRFRIQADGIDTAWFASGAVLFASGAFPFALCSWWVRTLRPPWRP